jgi:hypothetical protein
MTVCAHYALHAQFLIRDAGAAKAEWMRFEQKPRSIRVLQKKPAPKMLSCF